MSCRDLPVSLTLSASLRPSLPLSTSLCPSLPFVLLCLCPHQPWDRACAPPSLVISEDWIHPSTSPEVLSASSAHHFLKAMREISLAVPPRYAAWCLWVERWDRHSVSAEESDVEDDGA